MTSYTLKQPIPVLQVRDVQEGLDFFCQKLGFGEPWNHEGEYGGASKDGQHIHFMKKEKPEASMIYNFVDSADGIYESVQAAGIEIVSPIADQFYGMREFTLKDPSGNFIGYAASLKG
ncbi:MAG TPA: VOC family protein [Fimbriimonadaceae bacterium]|nr:VOC family protein [Fimbriimonadaceae bacterium]